MYIQHGHYPKNVEQVYRLVLHALKAQTPSRLPKRLGV